MALGETLCREFKLIRASVLPKNNILGILNNEPHLLTARFEINNRVYPVIIDTGATISFLPEHGIIVQQLSLSMREANVNIRLANGEATNVNKKTSAFIRPFGSHSTPVKATFYVNRNTNKILGHDALLGLKHLKLFELDIATRDGKILIYHHDRLIGHETPVPSDYTGGVKIDEPFFKVTSDQEVVKILRRYKAAFTGLGEEPLRGKPMRIFTVHLRPVFAKQRHYNPDEVIQMKTHVKELLDKGIIEPTNSGYAATSRMIPKKTGAGRLVVNYIPLNAITLRDSYCLPHVSDILGVLQGNEFFTTMDCAQGFYQILVDERDRHKTAFSTPIGNFQFKRCPFGARNSCAYFQAEMNRIFAEGLYSKCVIYVDDILVFGKTRAEHDANLEWVLSKCVEFNVKIKLEKCSFACKEVEYLGFVVSGQSIKPLKNKVDSICVQKHPQNKTELRSLIGRLNFYSRFISDYSSKIEPLRELFRKNKDFQWRENHQKAFEQLMSSLRNSSEHHLVDRNKPKVIEICVLDNSLEALLFTEDDKLIHRTSRLMSTTEMNYSIIEQHLLALVLGMNKFKIWLHPERFKVRSPLSLLGKTLQLTNRPERIENLLLKMPEGFDSFEFEVRGDLKTKEAKKKILTHVPQEIYYVDGACKRNGKPDCQASWAICAEFDKDLEATGLVDKDPSNNAAELTAAIKACQLATSKGQTEITIVTDSKYLHSAATNWIDKWRQNDWLDHRKKPVVNTELFKQLLNVKNGLQIEWIHVRGHAETPGNIRADNLARGKLEESMQILGAVSELISKATRSEEDAKQLKERIQREKLQNFKIDDSVIYYIDSKMPEGYQERIYVPISHRKHLLEIAHDDAVHGGHLGIKKTFRKLIKYWWPKMHHEVEAYVKSCDTCQRFKNSQGLPRGYLQSIPVSEVFEHLHLDIVGPMMTTCRGNRYIITATDAMSKWAFAKSVQSILTSDLIDFVESNIFAIHGKPKVIITDRGVQFTSHEWKAFIARSKVEHRLTTPYHPQSNGIDERLNGTLVRILRTYVDENHSDWDLKLKWALYIYNTTVHESTGYSPYQILHGLDPRSPLNTSNRIRLSSRDMDKMRYKIRREASESNKASQSRQKSSYDQKRKSCDLEIGQLVLIKIQVAPTDKVKKFYEKWSGPCMIIDFIGDKDNPRAIQVLDIGLKQKKVIAMQDVKPYLARKDDRDLDERISEITASKEAEENNLHDTAYYVSVEDNEKTISNREETEANFRTPDQSFDLWQGSMNYPLSSSPRRVTISDNVETYSYCPEMEDESTEILQQDHQPLSLHQGRIIENERNNESATNDMRQTNAISPYVRPYMFDDPSKDPTYKAPAINVPRSDRVLRSASQSSQRNLSSETGNIERYSEPTSDSENQIENSISGSNAIDHTPSDRNERRSSIPTLIRPSGMSNITRRVQDSGPRNKQ